jgi:RND family efflux transporter MFP subunit
MSLRSLSCQVLPLLALLPAQAAVPVPGLVLPFRQVALSAQVSSHIVEMKVQEGDAVTAGQPLARLYGRLEELELARAKVRLERCEFEAKGVKRLFDSKVLPEAKALEARLELELARLACESAAEQVQARTLAAPIDGLVVERYRDLGEAVAQAQPVFRLLDLSKVWILCKVQADLGPRLGPGQKLVVRIPQLGAAEACTGEIVLVDPQVDAEGLVRLKLRIDNPGQRIRPGLKALVELPDA